MSVKHIPIQVGTRVGKLEVVGPRKDICGKIFYPCICDCGKRCDVRTDHLKEGRCKSCGCGRFVHHMTSGGNRHPDYGIWANMKYRCNNRKCPEYRHYGGRGISVCDRWTRFENFIHDMGDRPGISYTLERIDNEGNYEPGNCKWATYAQQQQNKRNNVLTWDIVREMRRLKKEDGLGSIRLSRMFGVSTTSAANVLSGKTWVEV